MKPCADVDILTWLDRLFAKIAKKPPRSSAGDPARFDNFFSPRIQLDAANRAERKRARKMRLRRILGA